jgi:uncharacterized membrane protein YraQ (UPF0718 family)
MFINKLQIAIDEFLHVGIALTLIIAVIAVITGFVKEYIPQEKLQKKLKEQNKIKGAFMGAILGILTPFCSASMVPVAMGMIQMSAPFSTVLPFLISAPLCNFVVVGIILATFGFKVAAIYFLWTFFCAIVAGLSVGQSRIKHQVKDLKNFDKNITQSCSNSPMFHDCNEEFKLVQEYCKDSHLIQEPSQSCSQTPPQSCCGASNQTQSCGTKSGFLQINLKNKKVQNALQFALALFKRIVPYAILGAAISGIALAFIPAEMVEKYIGDDSWYAIPVAAGIGVPLYLRIEMAVPLLNTLLAKGMSMGAAAALLIDGTGASIPELAILSSMLKPKGILAFTITVLTIAILGGVLFMFV